MSKMEIELLDTKEFIKKFYKFFEEEYKPKIRRAISSGEHSIEISFNDISLFDFQLSDKLLENPIELLSLMEVTLEQFADSPEKVELKIRLTDLPETEQVLLREIRKDHINKLVLLEGVIKRKTAVRPRLKYLEYLCTNPECPFSKDKIKVPQFEQKARVLKACPRCKSGVEIINKIMVDNQLLALEELPEQLKDQADQPQRLNIMLQGDLVSAFNDSKTNPGSRVKIIGIVRDLPIQTKTGAESVDYDYIIDGVSVGLSEEEKELIITKEDEQKIKELSKRDNISKLLATQVAPSIYGNNNIKEALIIQAVKGVQEINADGTKNRGDLHILLIGDPGVAKSQISKAAMQITPRSVFTSGKSSSAAGMTASVVKDEITKGWALEAGAMVLASGGLCIVDEADKMSEEDTSSLHEAMEQQQISIAKANIRATLRAETSVLAAANPIHGRFDPFGDIGKQINMPPALLSRFDFIFVLRDIPDKKRDNLISGHMMRKKVKNPEILKSLIAQGKIDDSINILEDESLNLELVKKYIRYAQKLRPELSEEAFLLIQEFYNTIRNNYAEDELEGQKAIPLTARNLEAIVRIAEAYAKLNLSKFIEKEHAQKAIDLIMYCLSKIGIDPKTGQIDIDKITSGITQTTRNTFRNIQQIIDLLETQEPEIKYESILEKAKELSLTEKDVKMALDKLKTEGAIFEPRKNIFRKLN